jgi:hypothetical protein
MPRQRPIARVSALTLLLTTPGLAGCYSGLDSEQSASSPTAPTSPTAPGDPSGDPSASGSTGGDPTAGDPTEGGEAEFEPAPARLRLLLARQYDSSIAYLLGDAAAAVTSPPADSALNGFESIGAAQLALGDAAVDAYEASALAAADVAVGDPATIATYLPCAPTGPDDANCHRQFVTNFGKVAWRRSLAADEVERYTAVAQNAALELGDFDAGIKFAIAGMLQSPYFLYQVEVGEPDPNEPGERLLTGPELATRMSFFLLDTTPTKEIIELAESGGLDTPEEVRSVASTMVEVPAARAALGNFFAEVLRLRSLEALPKDPAVFPAWSPGLGAAMRQETLMLIEDVAFERDADFRDFLDAPYTFANGPLAALYGLINDPAQLGDAWQRFDLPEDTRRGGILGQGGFLAAYAHISSTSPTLRGKFVREILMCQGMPAPPPDVVTELPMGEYKTMRERLQIHLSEPACAGCHQLMDPIGLGLENFDGIGVFRLVENGVTLDTMSEIIGLGTFDGARELGVLLRDAPEVSHCLVRNLFRHATGHLETLGEQPALDDLDDAFAADGFRMKQLLVELVASPAFLRVGTPE